MFLLIFVVGQQQQKWVQSKANCNTDEMETKKPKKVRKVKKKQKSLIKANMTAEEKAEFRNCNIQLQLINFNAL